MGQCPCPCCYIMLTEVPDLGKDADSEQWRDTRKPTPQLFRMVKKAHKAIFKGYNVSGTHIERLIGGWSQVPTIVSTLSEICLFLSIFPLQTLSSHEHSFSYTCSHLHYALTTCLFPSILFHFTIHTKSKLLRTPAKSIRTLIEDRSYLLMRFFARHLLPSNTIPQGFSDQQP